MDEIIVVVVIVIVVVGLIFLYSSYNNLPTTDCGRFGINQGLPSCPNGTQEYGGVCYKDTWPDNTSGGVTSKGTKTAVCTVTYPDCPGIGICTHVPVPNGPPAGTPCNSTTIPGWDDTHFGAGWYYVYQLGVIPTCQRGGTQEIYCQSVGTAASIGLCAKGDNFEGICWGPETCASAGLHRTEICTCAT